MSSRSPGNKESASQRQKRKEREGDLLDPLDTRTRRFDKEIGDLPELPTSHVKKRKKALDAARTCEKCKGTEVRIVSNRMGVRAWCVCGNNWGVSMAVLRPDLQVMGQRGLSKQVAVEPDWNLAYEDLGEDEFFVRSDERDD